METARKYRHTHIKDVTSEQIKELTLFHLKYTR